MKSLLITSTMCAVFFFGAQKPAAAIELQCEMGQRMSIAGNPSGDSNIELLWRGRSYAMRRVATSTGAHRFENAGSGLVWVGIPDKGMLLDARAGRPLANECRTDEQSQLQK